VQVASNIWPNNPPKPRREAGRRGGERGPLAQHSSGADMAARPQHCVAPLVVALATFAALLVPCGCRSAVSHARPGTAFQQCAPPPPGGGGARHRKPQARQDKGVPMPRQPAVSGLSLDYCREAHRLAAAQSAAAALRKGQEDVAGAAADAPRARRRAQRTRLAGAEGAAGAGAHEEVRMTARDGRAAWLREDELVGESDGGSMSIDIFTSPGADCTGGGGGGGIAEVGVGGGGGMLPRSVGEDSLLSSSRKATFGIPSIMVGATEECGAQEDAAAYVTSLKQEVDSLVAQQRVGIAWTRFLRSVERRSRDAERGLSRT